MQIKFSFTREEFQRAGLRARPLKLQNADDSMSVELIGPIDLSPGKGFWDLLSPGLIRLRTDDEVLEIPAEEVALKMSPGALTRSVDGLALAIQLKHVHLLRPGTTTEHSEHLLVDKMWSERGWTLNILPIAKQLQGGRDNLLSSPSFRSGKMTLFGDAGEFSVDVTTMVNARLVNNATPSLDSSTPETERVLTGYSETNVASEQLSVPRCMRVPKDHEDQLPMPTAAGGQ